MNVSDLKPEVQKEMLLSLMTQLAEPAVQDYMTEEFVEEALTGLVDALDTADQEDTFGTEGWKHFFGFED